MELMMFLKLLMIEWADHHQLLTWIPVLLIIRACPWQTVIKEARVPINQSIREVDSDLMTMADKTMSEHKLESKWRDLKFKMLRHQGCMMNKTCQD